MFMTDHILQRNNLFVMFGGRPVAWFSRMKEHRNSHGQKRWARPHSRGRAGAGKLAKNGLLCFDR